jgi:hypothetical protein
VTDSSTSESSGLTPEQRLGPADPALITAGIVTIHDLETLQACVAYENQHRQRVPVLRRLAQRASELRAE